LCLAGYKYKLSQKGLITSIKMTLTVTAVVVVEDQLLTFTAAISVD
jgi:hypothetical protein